ncbi:MAG: hypothetical protein JSW59_04215 [Phycisphaerales bacterium]|nr:MAG: hypothetical protein JSW59_04215 [Phycisphaerales bacterium]
MRFTALRFFIKEAILSSDIEALQKQLEVIRKAESLDILTLTDENGKVIARTRKTSGGPRAVRKITLCDCICRLFKLY